jgi:hypothetical protein
MATMSILAVVAMTLSFGGVACGKGVDAVTPPVADAAVDVADSADAPPDGCVINGRLCPIGSTDCPLGDGCNTCKCYRKPDGTLSDNACTTHSCADAAVE